MPTVHVTTSWDDGHVLDVRLVALLNKYSVKGTLYISPKDRELTDATRLSEEQLKELAKTIEIGAHTMTHPRLTKVSDKRAKAEIVDSKKFLERVLGTTVSTFCYPGGAYRKRHISMVANAGFTYARTVRRHSFQVGAPLEGETTLHTYNHWLDLYHIARFARWNPWRTYRYFQWDVLAKAMFDDVLENGGTFHLWGHSWEIEKHGDWDKLENVLKYISRRKGVSYIPNSELQNAHKQKLLVVSPYMPPHVGGVEQYVSAYMSHLCAHDKNWNVVGLTTSQSGKDEQTVQGGCPLFRLAYRHTISNSPFSFGWIKKVRTILTRESPDIVNVHMPVPGLGDLVALLLPRKTRLVVTYHTGSMCKGTLLDVLIWLYEHMVLPLVLKKADHIFCTSEYVREGFLKKYTSKSSVLTPAVDTTVFFPDQQKRAATPTLLFAAGLAQGQSYKGLDILLDALLLIREKVPEIQLRVAGDGALRTRYESYAKEQGIENHVSFLGALEQHELAFEYQQAHLFVLPTEKESFGMAISEAMACELPVVSTRAQGIPYLIKDGATGVLLETRTPSSVAQAVVTLITDKETASQMGKAARKEIVKNYTWERCLRTYNSTLRRLLNPLPSIAHVVSYYPPHIGGMEVVADEVARESARRGHTVHVFTSDQGIADAPRYESDTNFTLRRLRSFEFAHTPILWSLVWHLLRLPRDTVIHLHLAHAYVAEIALFVAKVRGFPIIAQFHLDVGPSGALGWLFVLYKKHILGRIFRQMDAVMVFSEEQADIVVRKHGVSRERIHFVSNAMSDSFFNTHPNTSLHTPMRILAVSRLQVQKRVERLIEAMALLDFPAELTLVGDGEDREELEALARKCAPNNITFVGPKTHTEIQAYHAWADVYALSSDSEGGMPLTALEAMAGGLPVVGSNVAGIRELVRGVGILVDNPSAASFAEAFTRLHQAPEELPLLSAKSIACAQQHTWPVAVDSIQRVYHAVEAKPRA